LKRKKPVVKRTILLDGDVVAYAIAAREERPTDWGDGVWTLHADEQAAKDSLDAYLKKLMRDLGAQRLVVALSVPSDECWRKEVYPAYKAHRANVRKPMILPVLKQHLRDNYEVWERAKLEGDDILGILATSPTLITGEKIIASIDKDLKTIPGLHYNLKDKPRGVFSITVEEANYWHLFMSLTGDPTDGFPGCPGIGPKKAAVILGTDPNFDAVVEAYAKAGLPYEEALRQARVARILRRDDYDFKKKEVKLWTPKSLEQLSSGSESASPSPPPTSTEASE
jgi:DNA polymerase-1